MGILDRGRRSRGRKAHEEADDFFEPPFVAQKTTHDFKTAAERDFTRLMQKVRLTLPIELQRQIFAHLLKSMPITSLTLFARPSLDSFPIFYGTYPTTLRPSFIQRCYVHPGQIRTIIHVFYEIYPSFEVANPTEIGPCLDTDFYDTGAKPKDAILSAFKVRGCLQVSDADFVRPRALKESFAPLISDSQMWVKDGFSLTVELWSKFQERLAGREAIGTTLWNVFQPLKEIVHNAEEKGANVCVRVVFGDLGDSNMRQYLGATKEQVIEKALRMFEGKGVTEIPTLREGEGWVNLVPLMERCSLAEPEDTNTI